MNATLQIPLSPAEEQELESLRVKRNDLTHKIRGFRIAIRELATRKTAAQREFDQATARWMALAERKYGK